MGPITSAAPDLHRRTHCRLCGSAEVRLAVPMKPSPMGDHYVPASEIGKPQKLYPLDLYLCTACGHVQNLDVVNPDLLFRHYSYVTSSSASLLAHFESYTDAVIARTGLVAGSLVVDIGSNDGSLLSMFKARGMSVLGVDPAVNVAQAANERGIPTRPDYFGVTVGHNIRQSQGAAQLVTANNVFAHADDLGSIVQGISELLVDDGWFVFEVSYLVDVVDRFLFDTVYHEHVSYHSIAPLRPFLRKYGLEFVDAERISSKGGSIRCFARKQATGAGVSDAVEALYRMEVERGFGDLALYRSYTQGIAERREALLNVLRPIKARGGVVAGFGASITVTTLLWNFELIDIIDFIVDDNSSKHGLYSPGCHIPVLAPSALVERQPDCTVILAWNYAKPIMTKHSSYIARGGCFVVPLPDLHVFSATQP
jgi:SAM-dependent methyltransferase